MINKYIEFAVYIETIHESSRSANSGSSFIFILLYALVFLGIIIIIRNFDSFKNAKMVKQLCKGKNSEQSEVIAYFLRAGCGAKIISDEQYLQMVDRKKQKYGSVKYALNKLGIDEEQVNEISPVCFEGFDYKNTYVKKTANGKWISSRYEVTWIFFSDSQVHVYSCGFDMDKENKKESTSEYFYRDVNSFSTISEEEVGQNNITVPTEKFGMYGAGINFECALTNCDNVVQSINGMRQKLREKKLRP